MIEKRKEYFSTMSPKYNITLLVPQWDSPFYKFLIKINVRNLKLRLQVNGATEIHAI